MQLNAVNMKSAVIGILFGLALALSAQAFLRPRVPHRPQPPYGGQSIIISGSEDSVKQAVARTR